MDRFSVKYDQTRLNLANAAAQEEQRRRAMHEEVSATKAFEPAVLSEFYKYQRIYEPNTTRRLVLEPGIDREPLRGHLRTFAISEAEHYSALSYVWGAPDFSETILLEGKRLAITPSLATALKHFRLPTARRLLWVDQICINQKDIFERNKQVQLMHAIFREATRVLVWLGPDEEAYASKAFQLCQSISSIVEDGLLYTLCKKAGAEFNWIPKKHWKALRELTQRPWFKRVWIPQEIGTETPAEIHWGTMHIDWDVLNQAMKNLDRLWELKKVHDIETQCITVLHGRFVRSSEDRGDRAHSDFVYQLFLSARSSATDPRDYIFSKLGHYSAWVESEQAVVIEPDYDNSVHAIYHELAIRILRTSPYLLILNMTTSPTSPPLPSWVPCWHSAHFPGNLIGHPGRYSASKDTSHIARFEGNFKQLILSGIVIDTISKIGDTYHRFNLSSKSSSQQLHDDWIMAFSTFPGYSNSKPGFRTEPKYLLQPNLDSLEVFLDVFAPAKCVADVSPIAMAYASGIAALSKTFSSFWFPSQGDSRKLVDFKASSTRPSIWMQVAAEHSSNRKFAVTKKGYMLMAPPGAAKGDKICVIFGGETPFILRPQDSSENYILLGEAYVAGLMNGQAIAKLDSGELSARTFRIH
ncbi:hypothetical protein TruAng_005673 [Truncatella angustata]|nr:hypothetical protein TruAng_005673 [Truncatella angustata]